jgi:LAO/AO transport system kinase
MASRGHLGGLAAATPQAVRILDAAGFDIVLVETVGVGQAEVEIASTADTALVVVAPGLGDSIQAAKAGILEIADIFVVNKSDRPGAHDVTRDLRNMLAMASYGPGDWKPAIVGTAAVSGDGIDELAAAVDSHRGWLAESGQLQRRREARARREISAIAVGELQRRADGLAGASRLDELAEQVSAGRLDPYGAADELIAASRDPS